MSQHRSSLYLVSSAHTPLTGQTTSPPLPLNPALPFKKVLVRTYAVEVGVQDQSQGKLEPRSSGGLLDMSFKMVSEGAAAMQDKASALDRLGDGSLSLLTSGSSSTSAHGNTATELKGFNSLVARGHCSIEHGGSSSARLCLSQASVFIKRTCT